LCNIKGYIYKRDELSPFFKILKKIIKIINNNNNNRIIIIKKMMINDKISERKEINIRERVTEKRFRNTKAVEYEIIITAEDWERDKKNKYIKLKFCDENK
jgi:hypothetical protein